MEYPLLTSIEYRNEPIFNWPFIEVGKRREHRLYYKLDDPGSGFDFYSVMWAGCIADNNPDIWKLSSVEVECGIHGNARFDGIRHLYWGDEKTGNYGYHYYADLEEEIAVLQALRELEIKHCRDHEN
jgi:hypothetical protein